MSLIGPYYSNRFNTEFNDSYTTIISIIIDKIPILNTPEEEGKEITLRSKHTLKIETHTWTSKVSKEEGKSPIEFHTYHIPYIDITEDIFSYSYNWLKSNIPELQKCIND